MRPVAIIAALAARTRAGERATRIARSRAS